ncbi:MAG: FhaA domain-containing protein, partial [Pyrinomonadaceae bacterium]
MSVLEKVRKWIDGDSAELVLEQAARDAQVKPRSIAEEFIVKIARAVEQVMQNEMVPLPQGTTIIPSEYIIFLSNEDDKEWQGAKRRGLEQGLYHILAERAKEIAGKKKLETKSFVVELRVDGTLEKSEINVQHSWEDSSGNKTGVLARPKSMPQQLPQTPAAQFTASPTKFSTDPHFNTQAQQLNNQLPPTVAHTSIPPTNFPQQVSPIPESEGEEMTHVNKRASELYRLEIWQNGIRQTIIPVFQNEVVIGRGSKSKPVDIPLTGDPEISRRHLVLTLERNGNYS